MIASQLCACPASCFFSSKKKRKRSRAVHMSQLMQ